jgi:hypothetical protein
VISVSSNGAFTFATGLTNGSSYDVTPGSQPTDQNCFVVAGSGVVGASNVTNVVVHCPFVQTVYNFGLAIEGYGLEVGVLFGSDGNLYGVATEGGPNVTGTINALGAGSFFKVTLAGEETDLWNFGSRQDGGKWTSARSKRSACFESLRQYPCRWIGRDEQRC